jgi:DMSO/TMAO reductase YedYZ molybdopterin-dependent catalytic subunit
MVSRRGRSPVRGDDLRPAALAREGTEGGLPPEGAAAPEVGRRGKKRLVLWLLLALAVIGAALGVLLPLALRSTGPDYLEVDPATGLHITGTPMEVEIATYRLKVTGKVERELSLSYEDILALTPKVTGSLDLVCPGYFVDKAAWSGVPFKTILDMAGVQADAAWVRMKAADGYSIKVELQVALEPDSFLAYQLDGKTLPVSQGFPLRAVFPGQEGNRWVKWILELVVE